MILLLPADILRPRRPDEHFAGEAAAARALGLGVALVDHDELASGAADRAVARVPEQAGAAVYRGWMLDAGRYAGFDAALRECGVVLRTDAAQYRRAHELPGWYSALAGVTPATAWGQGDSRESFEVARAALGSGAGVLRDYAKSMKHYWHEAAFVPDLDDSDGAWKVAARFRELREDAFCGGFVLRRFEHFASAEIRTWWVDGVCVLVGPHPDAAGNAGVDTAGFESGAYAPLIAGLGLPFVTLDLARRIDGVWRVIELGDGQVSDCPPALREKLVQSLAALRT